MEKNFFFALEINSPWPDCFPEGRHIKKKHLTLAFLGKEKLPHLEMIPDEFPTALVGYFDQPLFLPPWHPHVVAWHIHWLSEENHLLKFRDNLLQWLASKSIFISDKRPFLSHVTMARAPFSISSWKKSFSPLPLIATQLHLYESQGHSEYVSLWHKRLKAPFEELEHTGDIAYLVHGQSLQEIYMHAFVALCFSFPPCLPYFIKDFIPDSLDEIIITLNQIVSKVDGEIGCPFKAVSYHGSIIKKDTLSWEMIIDV